MQKMLPVCALTTQAVRRELQVRKEGLVKQAKEQEINLKTAHRWLNRNTVQDQKLGPTKGSSVLSPGEEEAIVAFRKLTQLPLDYVLYALQ